MAILLVGDLIVDRTWLVGKPAQDERFAAHYDVLPRNLIDPRRKTDVAGGIGTVARTLSAEGIDVVACSGWGADADPSQMIPPSNPSKPVMWQQIAQSSLTTIMTRVYVPVAKGATLVERFDRDAAVDMASAAAPDWPNPNDLELVVAGDYVTAPEASVLQLDDVRQRIIDYAKTCPLLLRSIRKDVVEALPWTLLSVNPYHLSEILGENPFEGAATREVDGRCIYHPVLLKTIAAVANSYLKTSGVRFILLNLERQGALLIDRDQIRPLLLAQERPNHQGVGATDVLLGHLAKGLKNKPLDLTDLEASRKILVDVCADAVEMANAFSRQALTLDRIDGWYTAIIKPATPARSAIVVKDPSVWQNELDANLASQDHELLLKSKVQLHHASWYLDDYLTVDPKFGADINRLKKQIREYLKSSAERPFVGALCGDPGSGKSTLARSIARALDCDFISENAAQWSSPEDLFWLCERVRTLKLRKKQCLVLIDEVDTPVAGQELYGKLLAPLWDGAYFIRGEERTLGSPTIFLLAGSTASWKDEKSLIDDSTTGDSHSKLRDLVSRFTVPPISIPSLDARPADVVYLAAFHLLRQSPRVERIQEGIFRLLLAKGSLRHGVRSVTRVIELFKSPKKDFVVATSDLQDQSQLELQIPHPLAGWDGMTTEVPVYR